VPKIATSCAGRAPDTFTALYVVTPAQVSGAASRDVTSDRSITSRQWPRAAAAVRSARSRVLPRSSRSPRIAATAQESAERAIEQSAGGGPRRARPLSRPRAWAGLAGWNGVVMANPSPAREVTSGPETREAAPATRRLLPHRPIHSTPRPRPRQPPASPRFRLFVRRAAARRWPAQGMAGHPRGGDISNWCLSATDQSSPAPSSVGLVALRDARCAERDCAEWVVRYAHVSVAPGRRVSVAAGRDDPGDPLVAALRPVSPRCRGVALAERGVDVDL